MLSKKELGKLLDMANLIRTNESVSGKTERAIKYNDLGKRVYEIDGSKLREYRNNLKI